MKKLLPISVFIAICILLSCRKDSNNISLGIDVQSSFNMDNVQVILDGKELFNRPLQTNYSIGVCPVDGQIKLVQSKGEHNLKVVVNNSVTDSENFSQKNNLYIGINYDRQINKISFINSNVRFVYD